MDGAQAAEPQTPMEQQTAGQIVRLNNSEQELRALIVQLQTQLGELEREVQRGQRRGGGRRNRGYLEDDFDEDLDEDEPPARPKRKQDLVDKKFFNPTPFTAGCVWKEWSEEFAT